MVLCVKHQTSWQIQPFGMSKKGIELETEDQKSTHKWKWILITYQVKTAIYTSPSLELFVMPFGLCNVPGAFQRIICPYQLVMVVTLRSISHNQEICSWFVQVLGMFQLKLKLLCFLLCWLLALVILSQPNMINTNPVKTETCQVQFSLTRVFQQKVAGYSSPFLPPSSQVACSTGSHS